MTHIDARADSARVSSIVRARRGRTDIDLSVVVAVFVGGFFGGASRYLIGEHWATRPDGFPWQTFAVNVSGAFALALLLVLVIEVFPPTKFVRPAAGTGFLGAYTTFSSLVVAADELGAHGHLGVAAAYLFGSTVAGMLLALAGIATGRWIARRGTP